MHKSRNIIDIFPPFYGLKSNCIQRAIKFEKAIPRTSQMSKPNLYASLPVFTRTKAKPSRNFLSSRDSKSLSLNYLALQAVKKTKRISPIPHIPLHCSVLTRLHLRTSFTWMIALPSSRLSKGFRPSIQRRRSSTDRVLKKSAHSTKKWFEIETSVVYFSISLCSSTVRLHARFETHRNLELLSVACC